MKPSLDMTSLKLVRWWEHAIRFAFGGAITALAGLIGSHWGPHIGGLFLAFPAILPASLTLVHRHDGRAKAADDARGAVLGAIALAVFGATVVILAKHSTTSALLVLAAALGVWLAAAIGLWSWRFGARSSPNTTARRARGET